MVSSNDVMLEVKNLSKNFGQVQAVKGLNFEVNRGEIFGFLGPNGAGKTTTMRIVTCFMPPSAGTVKVAGMNTADNDLRVRARIGYLPESNPLYGEMLVEEYLQFVGRIRNVDSAKLSARIGQMCEICGLTRMRRRQIGKLSKGYRQRVGLAQAIIHDPDLLILDEPTSGLDPNQIIEIRQLIKELGERKTVIYCSHILPEVSATCSRILIINEGKLVANGTPTQLLSTAAKRDRFVARIKGDRNLIEQGLAAIAGVQSVMVRGAEDQWAVAEIVSGDDIGEAIFKRVVQSGWALSELTREKASLEDVFTQLTKG